MKTVLSCRHVCDGARQCPNGDDENECSLHNCSGLFTCAQSNMKICLHPVSICDEIMDCPLGEDEYLCELPSICPDNCNCLMYAIQCVNSSINVIHWNIAYAKLVNTMSLNNPLCLNNSVVAFIWTSSFLIDVCSSYRIISSTLQLFDASYNNISLISAYCFFNVKLVKVLLLLHNSINTPEGNAFTGLTKLVNLDISCNYLTELSYVVYQEFHCHILNIQHNNLIKIDIGIRTELRVDLVISEDYRVCCLLESTDIVCTSKPIWPESCSVMLVSIISKICVVIEFSLIIILNCISVINVIATPRKISSFTLNLLSLNINDILFGIYLLAIFCVDHYYGILYVISYKTWLTSVYCKGLGIISLFALFNSLFLLNMMSLSKLVIVKYPFSRHLRNIHTIITYISTGFVLNLLMCTVILNLFLLVEGHNSMPSSSCLLLGETSKSITIKLATIITATIQIMSVVSVSSFYITIVKELQKPHVMPQSKIKMDQVFIQSSLVTISNTLCWLPSSIIYCVSVILKTYPTQLLSWNAVLINPINSVINPIIFCVVPLLKKCLRDTKL